MEGVTRQCLRKPQLLEKKSVSKEGSNQGASFICSTLSHSPTKPKPLSVSALSCQFPIGQDRNLWFNVLPSLYSLDPPSHPKTKSVLFFFKFVIWQSPWVFFSLKVHLLSGQTAAHTWPESTDNCGCAEIHWVYRDYILLPVSLSRDVTTNTFVIHMLCQAPML